ncbi:MAG: hypothetical protein JXN59_17610 [Anaerolineae bacterium]|nr:hypothetical protein [Anaerolineae bacterium]
MATPLSMIDLIESFRKPGCPVCRITKKDVESFLHSMLFEGYKFPETHERFRAGRGLCNAHAWQMAESFRGALLNIGLYYRGALNAMLRDLDGAGQPAAAARSGLSRFLSGGGGGAPGSALADALEAPKSCVACEIRVTSEALYTRTIGEHISNPKLAEAYRASEGVCLPHLRMALRAATPADQRVIIAIQRGIWEALLKDLDQFAEMHDHRHTGEYMGAEGDSWLRALRGMAGEDGMFGMDDRAEKK